MKVAVITKQNIADLQFKDSLLERIKNEGSICVYECISPAQITPDCDRILVFGGDGTVLDTIPIAAQLKLPILCINLGNLGFLAEFEQDVNANDVIDALKSNKTVERLLLDITIDKFVYKALNEVVIKSTSTRPIHLDLLINGEYVDSYHSDGLIISSPTGSTAYSLSAGGPVLSPDIDAIVINPICPHSLHSRPLVISADSKIEVKLNSDDFASVIIDGTHYQNLNKNNIIRISKSVDYAKFISVTKNNFYKKLLEKMNRWGTTQNRQKEKIWQEQLDNLKY